MLGLFFAMAVVMGFWPVIVLFYIVVLQFAAVMAILPSVYGTFVARPTPVAGKLKTILGLFLVAVALGYLLVFLDWPKLGNGGAAPTFGYMAGASIELLATFLWVLGAQIYAVAGQAWDLHQPLPAEDNLGNWLGASV